MNFLNVVSDVFRLVPMMYSCIAGVVGVALLDDDV